MRTSVIRLVIAAVVVLGFFAVLFVLMAIALDPTTETVLKLLAGALVFAVSQVIQFYFGSSQSSKDKTAVMTTLLNGKE